MQTIDFLPEAYKISRQRRHAHYYRLGAVGLVVLIIGGSTVGVQSQKQWVRSQIEQLKTGENAAAPHMERISRLRAECEQLERQATLLRLLQCEPKVSTMLAAVANQTPPGARITSLTVSKRSNAAKLIQRPAGRRSRRRSRGQKAEHVDDLTRLRRRLSAQEVQVDIAGLALGNVQVVTFVRQLKQCPLVARAVLVVSSPQKGKRSEATEFEIRCELIPPSAFADGGSGA